MCEELECKRMVFEEIKQLRQSQTNVLTFGAGIVGLILSGIISFNSPSKNISCNTLWAINYIVLVGVFPFLTGFLYLFYRVKSHRMIDMIGVIEVNRERNIDILLQRISQSELEEKLVKKFLLYWFPLLNYICLAFYDVWINGINTLEYSLIRIFGMIVVAIIIVGFFDYLSREIRA